jgi:hypothetical protein
MSALDRLPLQPEEGGNLRRLTDAVLSFTAFYLRHERVEARPEQIEALNTLTQTIDDLEKLYEPEASPAQLAVGPAE